jgi:hypothetical protein
VCYAVTTGAVHRGYGTVQCEPGDRVLGYEETITFRISPERRVSSDFSLPVQWLPKRDRGTKTIRDQLPGYPWTRFCNGTVMFTYFCS